MLFALLCKDKPGHLNVRMETRSTHLDYLNKLNAEGKLAMAGPFLDAEGKPNGSLIDFASSSTSWIENQRKTADSSVSYQKTLLERSTAALSNVSGVNMDDEMSLMLQVERTYSASSKIISTVDEMLQSLLAAVGN